MNPCKEGSVSSDKHVDDKEAEQVHIEYSLEGKEKEKERDSTIMQLSHCVVCILNSSCNRKRVEATEFPKQQKT